MPSESTPEAPDEPQETRCSIRFMPNQGVPLQIVMMTTIANAVGRVFSTDSTTTRYTTDIVVCEDGSIEVTVAVSPMPSPPAYALTRERAEEIVAETCADDACLQLHLPDSRWCAAHAAARARMS